VDAQRDEEDEREQRQRRLDAGVAEHLLEQHRPDAERRRERDDDRRDEQQRRDERPQQPAEDREDDEQDEREDERGVALHRLADVVLLRRRSADERALAARLVDDLAQLRDEAERRLAVGVG